MFGNSNSHSPLFYSKDNNSCKKNSKDKECILKQEQENTTKTKYFSTPYWQLFGSVYSNVLNPSEHNLDDYEPVKNAAKNYFGKP